MAGPKTKWIVWYDDKSSFSNEDGEPWEAPRDGVICISQHHWSCGRLIIGEVDFYCWHFEDNEWVPHDRLGMMQYLRKPGKEKVVIEGYWVPRERFREIGGLARHDKRLPPKTAGEPPLPEGVRHYLED